jgi:hypothetical protein
VTVRFWLAALGCVSMIALACGGESQGIGGHATTSAEQVETTPTLDRSAPSSEECPADWAGPWTVCPEAEWVRRVTERAGYRITGDTGSALVARGHRWGFYIWATKGTEADIERAAKDWRYLGPVEGIRIYGDETFWRWWVVDGRVVWIQAGPYASSRIPPLERMESLVVASTLSR